MRTIQLPIVMAIVGLPLAITAATVVMRALAVPRHRQFTKRIRHSIHCDENIVFLAIQPWFRQVFGPRPL